MVLQPAGQQDCAAGTESLREGAMDHGYWSYSLMLLHEAREGKEQRQQSVLCETGVIKESEYGSGQCLVFWRFLNFINFI